MEPNYQWHEGSDAQSLAENLAGELVIKIGDAISERGLAVLALSGGSTPKPLFKALAEHDIEWSKVIITLVDERWVAPSHELSNAAFMHRFLLDALPDTVRFVPLYQAAESVQESLSSVLGNYCHVTRSTMDQPRPFDIVILGMGEDGHTASFFPDADNIAQLVDPLSDEFLMCCSSPSTQVPRVTWSLPQLLTAPFLALHFTGESKRAVFERACGDSDATTLPIRSAIFQTRVPLNVYYAA
ncbi:6-phosphogluconolactonase [Arenicella xantha]|uniref:6-phosphogluconolactonase n=1 Tax=Arenicella xantha TaxID=644221 RepID=A0A395JLA1_9GAMM|nr:6-phosphogluconolactonase [Arenicella xantha]RBP49748.1 6-phosphogluconolactonase [Arenicella xantha]